jgi:hypothetical protein
MGQEERKRQGRHGRDGKPGARYFAGDTITITTNTGRCMVIHAGVSSLGWIASMPAIPTLDPETYAVATPIARFQVLTETGHIPRRSPGPGQMEEQPQRRK